MSTIPDLSLAAVLHTARPITVRQTLLLIFTKENKGKRDRENVLICCYYLQKMAFFRIKMYCLQIWFQVDLRGIRLKCNAICWLLDKTFTDSEMRILLDGAPCLDPLAGLQLSSLNKDMLDCLGGEDGIQFYFLEINSG